MLCEQCEDLECKVCGHPACPVCMTCCDHYDCITWTGDEGVKAHVCEFPPCPAGCVRSAKECA
jgi:hypothetical protein